MDRIDTALYMVMIFERHIIPLGSNILPCFSTFLQSNPLFSPMNHDVFGSRALVITILFVQFHQRLCQLFSQFLNRCLSLLILQRTIFSKGLVGFGDSNLLGQNQDFDIT